MRSMFLAASVAIVCVSLSACGGWKSGQANSSQGNISKDSRPPATANASSVPNAMLMLAVALPKDRALQVMKVRHDGMEQFGKDTKALGRELKSSAPDLAVVRASAADIAKLSKEMPGWFPAGTGPDVGKTRAKPDIWQNAQDFSSKMHNFQVAARAFDAAARSGDVGAIKARGADLGGACKACHDKYRAEEKH